MFLIFITETQVIEVQRTPALDMSFLINLASFVQVGESLPFEIIARNPRTLLETDREFPHAVSLRPDNQQVK